MGMSKKRGKSIKININLSNRWLYTLILIGILVAVGVGIYAATYSPSGAGHPYTEISTCGANQVLQMSSDGTAWTCSSNVVTKAYADANYKDPPGQWNCTLRSTAGSGVQYTYCVGSEKVITGGCKATGSHGEYLTSYPLSNGWGCWCSDSALCGTVTANAYCCL
jgi:hypothetical protein